MSTKFFPKRGVPCNFFLFFAKVAGNALDGRAGVCYDEIVPRMRLLWSVQPDTGHVCGKNFYDMEEPEMKKTKKLAALVLAMLMAFSLMAVTASAYDEGEHVYDCTVCCEEEGIMPLGPVDPAGPPCIICGGSTAWTLIRHDNAGLPVYGYMCVRGCRV